MKPQSLLFLLCCIATCLNPLFARAADDTFRPLFNGKNLEGWDGNPELWSVENGVINGKTSGPDQLTYNQFLIWRGGEVKNFILHAKIKVRGNNSGIQYRSRELPQNGKWSVGGYQCDVHPKTENNAMVYDEKGRGVIVRNGQDVVVDPEGQKWLVAERDPVEADVAEWNEYTIIARGNRLIHRINGKTTINLLDHDEKARSLAGLIAFQLHRGPAMTIQIKDVKFRELPDHPIISYAKNNIPADARLIEKRGRGARGKGKAKPVKPALKRAAAGRPNILFIVSDDHGWGDLPSNWDDTEVRLPTLGDLAAQGVRFSNYHTVPLCGPSRACMFTGQFSTENGMWRGPGKGPLGSPGYRGIKRDVIMLSEHLSRTGYHTGCFGKWHMGSLEGEVPNDRGFDEFHGFLAGAHSYWITPKRSKIMHNRKPDSTSEGHATELFTGWAEQFIRESVSKDEPFFCYLAYNAVHGPLRTDKSKPASAPEAWVKKTLDRGVSFLRSDYVAILEHMDHNIGKLVNVLDELSIASDTVIVFVSDNGGCTMEEGAAGGRYPGNNGLFSGGKGTTYQGGLNVPFLMNWKDRLPQGVVSKEQVMHCDVYATLLDVAGIPVPKMNGKNPVRGTSLMPHMLSAGKKTIPERAMIFELWGNVGVRKGDYKLWANVGRDHSPDWNALVAELKGANLALFDLSKDISEKNDLRTELPEVYGSLKKELIDYFSQINAEYPVPETSGPSLKDKPEDMLKGKAPGLNSNARTPDELFKARDRNGDGMLTLEEFIGKAEKGNAPARTKRFKKIDSNGDGKLQLDELKK